MLVELEVGRVDVHVGARQFAELAQLGVGERRLGRAAPSEHHDLLDRRAGERLERVVGRVGRGELAGIENQHPGDVDRDVAVADHHGTLRGLRSNPEVARVRMAVVPVDELGRAVRARSVLARDAEPVVVGDADRIDDRVVALEQLGAGDVVAEGDAAEEAKARLQRRLLVHARDRLDLRVVGRDARAD